MLKLNITATGVELTPEIAQELEEKIGTLDVFIEGTEDVAQAWVEVSRTTRHHRQGNIFRAEVQIRLPGAAGIRAEAEAEDILTAITTVKDELQRQLKKYKGKRTKHESAEND
ncbi:MAG: ribosome-associated translation inhibitor RaiA [bacterium]|nr:ribosome-associated translation inhibitor RaiA [bacterium]